jgi:hypothetical protein
MNQNPGFGYLGKPALDLMNEMFLESEARIQVISIRQQKRYKEYILNMDRQLIFPYAPRDRIIKGEAVIDTSGYLLSNPWKNKFGQALVDIYGNPCCSSADSASQSVPRN